MKLTFILFAFIINFSNPFFIKAEETVDSSMDPIKNNFNKESKINEKPQIKKIHIVQVGDTISSISELYAIDKSFIVKLNNLKDENYIYVGQNLKIYDGGQKTENNENQKYFHLIQKGENLTEISNKYGLDLKYLIELNNLKNPDSVKVGTKLFLINQNNSTSIKDEDIFKERSNDRKTYGLITVLQNELEIVKGRKILNALNQNNKKLMVSVKCETQNLDVKIPGEEWRGWQPAKEIFEKNLVNDFC